MMRYNKVSLTLVSLMMGGYSALASDDFFKDDFDVSKLDVNKLVEKILPNNWDKQLDSNEIDIVEETAFSSLEYKRPKKSRYVKPSNKFTELILEDNFDELDFDKWRPEITAGGGGNWEFQFYSNDRKTSYVSDGNLHLRPIFTSEALGTTEEAIMTTNFTLDLWGNAPGNQCTANGFIGCQRKTEGKNIINPMASAQLRSVNGFNFKYGKVEVRAKMPKGDWLWPAIWLMPQHHAYGGWPASGEIDIIESRGNLDDCHGDGVSTVGSALHWGLNYTNNKFDLTHDKFTLPGRKDFNQDFHVFTMEWTKDYIRTWVDNIYMIMNVEFTQPMHKFGNFTGEFNPWHQRPNNAPFDQKFYLIFNLAVGGTGNYFKDTPDSKKLQRECSKKHQRSPKLRKPYLNNSTHAPYDFLTKKHHWLPTWQQHTDQSHLIIDYVKVYKAPSL